MTFLLEDIKNAECIILKHVQSEYYSSELSSIADNGSVSKSSRLFKLHPCINDSQLFVVHGRLKHSCISEVHKHPIIVPHEHPVASMIVRDIHGSAHLGQEWVISLVRCRYWITNLRCIVKRVSRSCVICKRRFGKPAFQQMADLPQARVSSSGYPFFDIGVDCFGPFFVHFG